MSASVKPLSQSTGRKRSRKRKEEKKKKKAWRHPELRGTIEGPAAPPAGRFIDV